MGKVSPRKRRNHLTVICVIGIMTGLGTSLDAAEPDTLWDAGFRVTDAERPWLRDALNRHPDSPYWRNQLDRHLEQARTPGWNKFEGYAQAKGRSPLALPTFDQMVDADRTADNLVVRLVDGVNPQDALIAQGFTHLQATNLRQATGGIHVYRIPDDEAFADALEIANAHPLVEYAEANYLVDFGVVPNDPFIGPNEWWLLQINAYEAWDIATDASAIGPIGVYDQGILRSHEDLQGNFWVNPDEIPGNGVDDDGNGVIDDINGRTDTVFGTHGTPVAGTIAARGNNGIGYVGSAWTAQIMDLGGTLSFADAVSDCVASLQYAVGEGCRISNHSWRIFDYSQALKDVVEYVEPFDHLMVCAAGNENSNNDIDPRYPTSYEDPNILSIAASTFGDARISYSSYGATSVDLAAPTEFNTVNSAGGYSQFGGTSQASPCAAGAVALAWAQVPSWNYAQIKQHTMTFARSSPLWSGLTVTGGILDMEAMMVNLEGVQILLQDPLPTIVEPDSPTALDVEIQALGQSLVPGSPTLHFRDDGGVFQTTPLIDLGDNIYQATLPASGCGSMPEFYFSAEGSEQGFVTLPQSAPAETFTYQIGVAVVVFSDNFETDQGWLTENLGATSGDWQRGVPVNDSGWDFDPISDGDGSGQCFLTQNELGNTDVDDGAVRLISPSFDLVPGFILIEYDYFLRLTEPLTDDFLLVEISEDGLSGPWTTLIAHDTNGDLAWRRQVFTEADLAAAGVTPGSNMRMRFTANDADPQSINESGLDGFVVSILACAGSMGACCFDDGSCQDDSMSQDCASQGGTYQGDDTSCNSSNCPQPGACCFDNGACTFGFQDECDAADGMYQGDNVSCQAADCPQPGACCLNDGTCRFGSQDECDALDGSYQGDGVTCETANCPQLGACCLDDGSCTFGFQNECDAAGGSYQGDNILCESAECPQPGACCFDDGTCTFGFQDACDAVGGTYQGDNIGCQAADCPRPGACCLDDGTCTFGFQADCNAADGAYQGDNVTCEAANCPQPGACCLNDGTCTFGFQEACDAADGSYQGDNESCEAADCPQPGACCLEDGTCTFGFQDACDAVDGVYQGDNVTCEAANCPQPGACCLDDGSCTFGFQEACDAVDGAYQGDNESCEAADCRQPGACCFEDGTCTFGFQNDCDMNGGTYQGDNVACLDAACPQPGACCYDDGDCQFIFADECERSGGLYQGDLVDCITADCPQPGACCLEDGTCGQEIEIGGAACENDGGTYQGDDTLCVDLECPAPCLGDINNDGEVEVPDLVALIAAWGKCDGCPEDLDGDGEVEVSDLLIVILNWGICP